MITDPIRCLLGEHRREILERKERMLTETLAARVDDALMELLEHETGANERAYEEALAALKAHVLKHLLKGDADKLPLYEVMADGRTIRHVCEDIIAAVQAVPTAHDEVSTCERFIVGTQERMADARRTYVEPLEDELAADTHALEMAKERALEAEKNLSALKRKYKVD